MDCALSARAINECIKQHFDESQIYRIDHYLTKELVSSIVLVRFTNMIFEPLWNNKYIEQVEIILNESIGIEDRGLYYDQYGILRDVIQNHALQLLALIAMDLPSRLDAHHIRDEKAHILKKVQCVDGILGQYRGYTAHKGVDTASHTPTFAALRMAVDTHTWSGVPFYIKAGKALGSKNSSIHITFKNVPCTLREQCVYSSNSLSIQIDPFAAFTIRLNTKQPGHQYDVVPVPLSFNHDYAFGTATQEA